MRLSLTQLERFVAAAEAGTITAGALRCQASQAAVSMAIAELEKRLGVQLLIRQQAKGVALTAAGARVLIDARSLLAQAGELISTANADGTDIAGLVTLGCYQTLAPFFVPPLLDEFGSAHPNVSLAIVDGSQDRVRSLLLSGQCDLALLYENGLDATGLVYTVIRRNRPYVVLAADHRLATHRTVQLSELADEPLIALDVPPSLQNSERVLTDAGFNPNVSYRTSNIEMVRCLVARGLGYGILVQAWPSDISYEGRRLLAKPIEDDVNDHAVVLAKAQGAKFTRRVEVFARYCTHELALASDAAAAR